MKVYCVFYYDPLHDREELEIIYQNESDAEKFLSEHIGDYYYRVYEVQQ